MSEEHEFEGTAVEVYQSAPTTLAVVPTVAPEDLVKRLDVIKGAMRTAMEKGIDYGNVPGTDKPTLLKPGAEKLSVLFQLDVQIANEKIWGPDSHLTVISSATVFHAPSGTRLGFGEGLCSTREKKYAYRKQERTCPTCNAAAVIKGKAEYGGGWLCWTKRDGCGAKFRDGDEAIEGQKVGEIDNPDLPDLWNTVVKMAEKRARVDGILAVTGASAIFTQDVEADPAPPPPTEPPVASQHPVRTEVPRLLTDEERIKVLEAVKDAGLHLPRVLEEAGVVGGRDINVEHARRVRIILDEAALTV